MSAAHVIIKEYDKKNGKIDPHNNMAAVILSNPGKPIERRIKRIHTKRPKDTLIGELYPMSTSNKTNHKNDSCLVTDRILSPGEPIYSFSFPIPLVEEPQNLSDLKANGIPLADVDEKFAFDSLTNLEQHIRFSPTINIGKKKCHEEKHINVEGSCYTTNMPMKGRSSGGPAFDKHGFVFGINSASFAGIDHSTVSSVVPILDFEGMVSWTIAE